MKYLFLILAVFSLMNTVSLSDTLTSIQKNKYINSASGSSSEKVAVTFDKTSSTICNVEFNITNDGRIGHDSIGSIGVQWPRGSKNYYIYGGGLWFGALKNVNGVLSKLCMLSYYPNSGKSFCQPSVITNTPDSESLVQTRVFRASDFNRDGTPVEDGFVSNWLIWDTDPFATLYLNGYVGNIVSEPKKRNQTTYPKGSVFISDEDFVTVFDDKNLNKYQGETDTLIKQGYPLNVRVIQKVYTWSSVQLKDAIIIEQKVTNIGKDTLLNCAIAPICDFDIGYAHRLDASQDDRFRSIKEDSALKLNVMWSNTGSNFDKGKGLGYMGVGFIRTPSVNKEGFLQTDNDRSDRSEQLGANTMRYSTITTYPGSENDVRYNYITSGYIDTIDNGGSDKCFFMSTYGFNLRPNDTATIAYIICFAKPSVKPEADGSWNDVQGVVNLFKKTRAFYDATFDKKTLGITNNDITQNGISVYPNPTNNRLFIQLSDDYRDAKVSLVTLVGNQIASSEQIAGGNVSIDVSLFAAGVYAVRVELKSGVVATIPVVVMR